MGKPTINLLEMAAFIQENLKDTGRLVNNGTSILIANIVTDFLALHGIKVKE